MKTIEPTRDQVLAFCADDPVERVFLEDVARRGLGSFLAVAGRDGALTALCHAGANLVPSGVGCAAFAAAAGKARSRMIIGEARAVTELWDAARDQLPEPREDRPHQPVYAIDVPPPAGGPGCVRRRRATSTCSCRLVPRRPARTRHRPARTRPRQLPRRRQRRSTRDAPASGSRTTSCCSRRGLRLDAAGGADPGGPRRPRRRGGTAGARGLRDLCRSAARNDAQRHPVRAQRERPRDRPLRRDRHEQGARVPQHPL